MAIKKATTTDDITPKPEKAPDKEPSTTKVKSPTGSVTEVPEGILQALLDSGYTKSK